MASALACLACNAMDNSTDSFRMEGSFRMKNISSRSTRSDEGREGCGRVATCFPKHHSGNKPASVRRRQQQRQVLQGLRGERNNLPTARDSVEPSPKVLQRGGSSMAAFGLQPSGVSMDDDLGFPEPRLTRCHAVRRDLFRNFSVGESSDGGAPGLDGYWLEHFNYCCSWSDQSDGEARGDTVAAEKYRFEALNPSPVIGPH